MAESRQRVLLAGATGVIGRQPGLHVTAVQNPLTSFADDVAAARRLIATQDGPVLLVGHSCGGAVITEAGNDPKVARPVYVAAFAPDKGESAASLGNPTVRRPVWVSCVRLTMDFW